MAEDSPNPLLLQWVKEKWDWAREKNLKSQSSFGKAYRALEACPIAFKHPSQLKQLRGFGPVLCEELTKKLQEHCEANGLPMPSKAPLKKAARDSLNGGGEDDSDSAAAAQPAKKPRAKKPYVPAYRSGAYAILLALATLDEDANMGMSKADLVEAAQPHSDASFAAPSDATKFYTAWASMKTLQAKELVYERGRPTRRYALTDEGWEVARRVKEIAVLRDGGAGAGGRGGIARQESITTAVPVPASAPARTSSAMQGQGRTLGSWVPPEDDDDDLFVTDGPTSGQAPVPPQQPSKPSYEDVVPGSQDNVDTAIPVFTPIRLEPGTFTVHLVLDTREVRTRKDRDYLQEELTKKGVKPLVRALEIGDVTWVAKCHDPTLLARQGCGGGGSGDEHADEVVLDHVLERKRLDDLVSSLKDGRFHEQKFRLRRSGVRHVIYLVEETSVSPEYLQRYEDSIHSALAGLQLVNGYFLKQTRQTDETIRYLARLTGLLKATYEGRALSVVPTPVLTGGNYLPLLRHLRETRPAESWHVAYPAFASLASKSGMMTLRDVFLKMLMCARGVSGEKAVEIQRRWPTPAALAAAFDACGDGEAGRKRRRDLVARELGHLLARKKINAGVSRNIAEVWGDA